MRCLHALKSSFYINFRCLLLRMQNCLIRKCFLNVKCNIFWNLFLFKVTLHSFMYSIQNRRALKNYFSLLRILMQALRNSATNFCMRYLIYLNVAVLSFIFARNCTTKQMFPFIFKYFLPLIYKISKSVHLIQKSKNINAFCRVRVSNKL